MHFSVSRRRSRHVLRTLAVGVFILLSPVLIAPTDLHAQALRHRQRTYGFLIIARKENATFAKKEKGLIEQAGDDITKALEREGLFDMNVVLSRPYVSREPAPAAPPVSEIFAAPTAQFTPELEEKIVKVLEEHEMRTSWVRGGWNRPGLQSVIALNTLNLQGKETTMIHPLVCTLMTMVIGPSPFSLAWNDVFLEEGE